MNSIFRMIFINLILLSSLIWAKDEQGYLIVGTKIAPPFSMKKPNGQWYGVSIDLWKEIAKKLNLHYKFQEDTLDGLIDKIKNKKIEVAIAAITVSAKREHFADFSNGYYTEVLSIAIPKNEGSIIKDVFNKLFSYTTLWVVLAIIVVIHIAGIAFWLMERTDGNNQGKSSIKRISSGIWWAAVTLATLGRGDVIPKTKGGRVVAIVWMFVSVFVIALIIAAFTSFFTSAQKIYFINSFKDLDKGKIATIRNSYSDEILRKRGLLPVYYNSLKEALNAVKNEEVDAIVYDKQLLKYMIDRYFKDSLTLTKEYFMPQSYSLIFKEDCHLKESINRALLEVLESEKWKIIKDKYLFKENSY